jgi:hypothetical protein
MLQPAAEPRNRPAGGWRPVLAGRGRAAAKRGGADGRPPARGHSGPRARAEPLVVQPGPWKHRSGPIGSLPSTNPGGAVLD